MSNIKKGVGAAVDKRISFLSDNHELNAAISRYFKFVHKFPITTHIFPHTPHQSTNILVVQNEIEINSSICGIYPFWFDYGIRNNIIVYGFTYEATDWQNNLLDWQDLLGLQWLNSHHNSIDLGKVPYFDSSRSALYGVLKPHGGNSLYDLASALQFTFADAPRYIVRMKEEKAYNHKSKMDNIQEHIILRGIKKFKELQVKEDRHHVFLSILPESSRLFSSLENLSSFIDQMESLDFEREDILDQLLILFQQIKIEVNHVYEFFHSFESFLKGDFS